VRFPVAPALLLTVLATACEDARELQVQVATNPSMLERSAAAPRPAGDISVPAPPVAEPDFEVSPDPLGVVIAGRGPRIAFRWPRSDAGKRRLWTQLQEAGARAVFATVDGTNAGVVGAADGRRFSARDYSPLVRLAELDFMVDAKRLGAVRKKLGASVQTGYVMSVASDQALFANLERAIMRRLDTLDEVGGRLVSDNAGATVVIERIDAAVLEREVVVSISR
jgi:hypothetical protein